MVDDKNCQITNCSEDALEGKKVCLKHYDESSECKDCGRIFCNSLFDKNGGNLCTKCFRKKYGISPLLERKHCQRYEEEDLNYSYSGYTDNEDDKDEDPDYEDESEGQESEEEQEEPEQNEQEQKDEQNYHSEMLEDDIKIEKKDEQKEEQNLKRGIKRKIIEIDDD